MRGNNEGGDAKDGSLRTIRDRAPDFSVGMGPAATPELAAAVSNAGGCGVLGGGGFGASYVREQVRRVRTLTNRPFGINVILGDEDPETEPIEACIAERVPILVFFWGDPRPFVADAHRQGVKVLLRVIRNSVVREWEAAGKPPTGQRPGEGTIVGSRMVGGQSQEIPKYASMIATLEFTGDLEAMPFWAGQSCSLVKDIKPAGDIVRDTVREAEAVIEQLKGVVTAGRPSVLPSRGASD